MTRRTRPRRFASLPALASTLALALALGGGACKGDGDGPETPPAPRVVRDEQPPAPAPVPSSPKRRLLDPQGELLESANELFGFRLPVGVREISQEPGQAVLYIEVPLDRLARFYMTRGYPVLAGKAGFIVSHSAQTLADEPNADALKDAQLFLRKKQGRVHELRFMVPLPEEALPAEEPL